MARFSFTTYNNGGGSYYGGGGGFSFFTPVIKTLLITNVVIFIFQSIFLDLLTVGGAPMRYYVMNWFALQPIESGHFMPWQLVTYQFMHGGVWHLLMNMFALWMFGSELESLWGSRRFTIFYVLAGIGAGLAQLAVGSLFGMGGPTVGASGSIQGVMIAFGFMFPDRPILMFPIFFPIPAKIFVLVWIGIDLISGLTGNDGVAHFAHLGGALTGYLLLRFGDQAGIFGFFDKVSDMLRGENGRKITGSRRKIYDIREADSYSTSEKESISGTVGSWFRAQSKIDGSRTITQEEIDGLLDKIAKSGYNSLSDEEKRVLMEASKKL
ncbi:MAG: rhomboid family intramembrane serine protease [Candidatus Kapaibacterium sp.]|nr:MAG: rhomboid family intramembrane serine protease [Candidatus Kapabacteria bacterium]